MTQDDIIRVVKKHGPIYAGEIARKLNRDATEIAMPLSRLVKKNVLTKELIQGVPTKSGVRNVNLYKVK